MAIVMNMSSYAIEEKFATESAHENEAMRAGANLQLAIQQCNATLMHGRTILPPSLAMVDVDMFLQCMSANRR